MKLFDDRAYVGKAMSVAVHAVMEPAAARSERVQATEQIIVDDVIGVIRTSGSIFEVIPMNEKRLGTGRDTINF